MAFNVIAPDVSVQPGTLYRLYRAGSGIYRSVAPDVSVETPVVSVVTAVAVGAWTVHAARVVTLVTPARRTSAAVDVTAITAADWSRKVGAYGEIVQGLEDIAQCIRIILATPKGSVPHRPQFGCDAWRYLDHPESQSLPHVIRECTDALAAWEPRATVSKITASYGLGQVNLVVHWTARLGSAGQTTTVALALTSVQ